MYIVLGKIRRTRWLFAVFSGNVPVVANRWFFAGSFRKCSGPLNILSRSISILKKNRRFYEETKPVLCNWWVLAGSLNIFRTAEPEVILIPIFQNPKPVFLVSFDSWVFSKTLLVLEVGACNRIQEPVKELTLSQWFFVGSFRKRTGAMKIFKTPEPVVILFWNFLKPETKCSLKYHNWDMNLHEYVTLPVQQRLKGS